MKIAAAIERERPSILQLHLPSTKDTKAVINMNKLVTCRREGAAAVGGPRQGRDAGGLQAVMQGLSDSPRKLAAFQRDLDAEAIYGGGRVHHSPHSTGLFGNGPSQLDGSSDSD